MMPHDPKQLEDLYRRALKVLGSDAAKTVRPMTPRGQVFTKAMSLATKAMGSPDKVTDEQILGALEIAHEVYPPELEAISDAMKEENKSGAL